MTNLDADRPGSGPAEADGMMIRGRLHIRKDGKWIDADPHTIPKCGNCHRWGTEADESDGYRPCLWTAPALPFWADIENGDHGDWTKPEQGARCPTFTPKEGKCTCQLAPGKVEGFAAVALDCPIHGDDSGEQEG